MQVCSYILRILPDATYDFAAICSRIRCVSIASGRVYYCFFALEGKTFQHNQCRTDTNGSIGKVEGGEVPVADIEVDHIDNEAKATGGRTGLPSAPP